MARFGSECGDRAEAQGSDTARFGSEFGNGNPVQGGSRVQESCRAAGFGSECGNCARAEGSGPSARVVLGEARIPVRRPSPARFGAQILSGAQVQDPVQE